jgi:hypothetical protein
MSSVSAGRPLRFLLVTGKQSLDHVKRYWNEKNGNARRSDHSADNGRS